MSILVVDKDGNITPVASLKMHAKLQHAGQNVWRVSDFGVPLTHEWITTVTNIYTMTKEETVTKDIVTKILTQVMEHIATRPNPYETSREAFHEYTKTVTSPYVPTRELSKLIDPGEVTTTKQLALTATKCEATVTDEFTKDVVTEPEVTVTEEITREITVTAEVPHKFILYVDNINVDKDVAFDLTIQSVRADTLEPDTNYVPDTWVLIYLFGSAGYNIIPIFTDNTGWVSGAKTVSCTLIDGAGVRALRVACKDSVDNRYGEIMLVVDGVSNIVAPAVNEYWLARKNITEFPFTEANWYLAWDDAHHTTNLIEGDIANNTFMDFRHIFRQYWLALQTRCHIGRCFARFDVTAYKGSTILASLVYSSTTLPVVMADFEVDNDSWLNAWAWVLEVYAVSADPSGVDKRAEHRSLLTLAQAGSFIASISFQDIHIQAGAGSNRGVRIPISASVINNLVGTDLRIVFILRSDLYDNPAPFPGFTVSPDPEYGRPNIALVYEAGQANNFNLDVLTV